LELLKLQNAGILMLVELLLALAAFIGHFSLAVWVYNRLHALAGPVRFIKTLERLVIVVAALVLGLYLGRAIWLGSLAAAADGIAFAYVVACWIVAALVVPLWLVPKLLERSPPALVSNDTHVIDIAKELGRRPIHGAEIGFFAGLPGNQLFQLHVQRKTLCLPQLPRELDGLTIAHLSDLHMLGDLTEDFFHEVVAATNELDPDLVCLTGDILERERCLPWIASTLGQVQARHGRYFVLGNHELRLRDVQPLRDALTSAGWTDLGSRCESLTINGANLRLAGNELPWFGTAPQLRIPHSAFRILLAHTPDQLPWAKSQAIDLMLAGHNHGGQIRLPWLGALISPSWYGWRYAGGLYHEPPTLLHVSRGIAAKHPIRLNCPPELALLVLRSGTPRAGTPNAALRGAENSA
jgi:predicted MPP superfamily phosphohydrolase